jgi:transcriptional regulator with XRE-family HTH domain
MTKANGHKNGHAHTPRGLKLYRRYHFKGQDPVVERALSLVDRSGLKLSQAAKISGVANTTLGNWETRKTKRPQYATIAALIAALGYTTKFVKTKNIDFEREIAMATKEIAEAKAKLERSKRVES